MTANQTLAERIVDAACLHYDGRDGPARREEARALLQAHPEGSGRQHLRRLRIGAHNSHSPAAHQAAHYGHLAALEYLLSRGADPDIRDIRFKATALDWAKHAGQGETAAYLAARGKGSADG